MKRSTLLPMLVGIGFTLASGAINAQETRAKVKMDRDEFLKTHQWDQERGVYSLKSGVEPPVGVKTRDEIKAERDAFLAKNRWDEPASRWQPVKAERDMSTLSRQQVKKETEMFNRTHTWNQETNTYSMKPVAKAK